jgi:hypothetical protein
LFEDYPKEHRALLDLPAGDSKRRTAVAKKGRGTRLEPGGVGDFAGGMTGEPTGAVVCPFICALSTLLRPAPPHTRTLAATLMFALATGRAYQLYWPVAGYAFYSPWIDTNYTDPESYLDMEPPAGFPYSCCNVMTSDDGRAQHLLALVSSCRGWRWSKHLSDHGGTISEPRACAGSRQ